MARSTPKQQYGNDSISSLKGADRVRKRPGVIFGSDGLEGCEHAVFEILSNAIDEAREGHGDLITVTRYEDRSIEVEDFGRGCPVDWNEAEGRYNWELVFCELYAGGKYQNGDGDNYEYSLASTAWAPAPPSTPASISTRSSTGTASGTPSTSKRARSREGWTRPPPTGKRPAPASAGSPTWRCSPTSTYPPSSTPT